MNDIGNVIISARGLKRHFQRGSEIVRALDGVDLDVRVGEMISLIGPSGSGKTTLINLLSCLDAPTEGTLVINGKTVSGAAEDTLADVRRGVLGFVFQKFYLLPTLTVAENVELPLVFLRRREREQAVAAALKMVDLEQRSRHLPHQLSGGQMQRVAIARALVTRPRILIADEPTGNLDSQNSKSVFELFRRLVEEQGLTVIVTTHNLPLGYLSDRVITLIDGKISKQEHGQAPAMSAR
jgi:putative ABC transport system ATP-binding protein